VFLRTDREFTSLFAICTNFSIHILSTIFKETFLMFQSIQPKLNKAVTATIATTKRIYMTTQTTLTNGWKNHKKTVLWGLGILALAVIGTLIFVYLWRKSPAFRAIVLAVVASIALNANNLLTWLKRRTAKEETLAAETTQFGMYPNGILPDRDPGEVNLEGLNILTAEDAALVKSSSVEDGHLTY
jgi:hypothetical protein